MKLISYKTIIRAHWLWTSSLLPNGIEKLPLMVSQWRSNLVQFDSPLHRESSTKCPRRGWLCIAKGVVIWKLQPSWEHRKTAENIGKQQRTSESIYGTAKNIWCHPQNNWGPIIDNLVQFEEDFNTNTEMWNRIGWFSQTRPIPRSPDSDKILVFTEQFMTVAGTTK